MSITRTLEQSIRNTGRQAYKQKLWQPQRQQEMDGDGMG